MNTFHAHRNPPKRNGSGNASSNLKQARAEHPHPLERSTATELAPQRAALPLTLLRCVLSAWLFTLAGLPLTAQNTRPNSPSSPNGLPPSAREQIYSMLAARPPNILLILADDLGYGDLGCYGQTRIKTPHIDQFAREGIRFTQFYAGSTVCNPSRAALLTGLHTGHTHIRSNDQRPLFPEEITIAEMLAPAQYQSAVFGKWGLGLAGTTGIPNKQGFDEWFGALDHRLAWDLFPSELQRNQQNWRVPGNEGGAKAQYAPDLYLMATTNFLRTARYRPFFLYWSTPLPHANPDLAQATGNGMEIPSDAPYSRENWPQPEKNKAAMITRLDRDLGAIRASLVEHKMSSNTLVIITSDNGAHEAGGTKPGFFNSTGGLRGLKRDLYEGGIRVPFIAWWPGHIPAGKTNNEVWAAWDLMPTFAELARVKPPADIDGISMRTALLGQKSTNQHPALYWEYHDGTPNTKQAVRSGDWKLVRNGPNQPPELYRINDDPTESHNLAEKEPTQTAQLLTLLQSLRNQDPAWPLSPPPKRAPNTPPQPQP